MLMPIVDHSLSLFDYIQPLGVLNILCGAILCIGLIGNFVNIIVLTRRRMRHLLIFRLLLCLSIVDFIILAFCALETLAAIFFSIDVRVISVLFCKLNTFLAYFLLHIRNVFTISINFHSEFIESILNRIYFY
jgi:hypothetical protein